MTECHVYRLLCIGWAAAAVLVVPYLLSHPAPYGRHARPFYGPLIDARLSWALMEACAPLMMAAMYAIGNRRGNAAASAFLSLWLAHYVYRAFVFPLCMPPATKPMPLLVLASGALFNVINGYLNGRWLFTFAEPRCAAWFADPRFIAGALLFFGGLSVHALSDRALHRLRRAGGYAVPLGGLFRFVSSPNYLGEIIEWSGWALVTWSAPGLVFALWTAANLVPRAIAHHRWYRERFADYPRERRAIVPFLL